MAMIAVPVPASVGRTFSSIDFDGQKEAADHITLFFFENALSINDISKLLKPISEAIKNEGPFTVTCSKIMCFGAAGDRCPVVAQIKSERLMSVRSEMAKLLDKQKTAYSKKFKTFKPHVTLGYAKEKFEDIKIESLEWQVSEISLYGGDHGKDKVYVSFQLGAKVKQASFFGKRPAETHSTGP